MEVKILYYSKGNQIEIFEPKVICKMVTSKVIQQNQLFGKEEISFLFNQVGCLRVRILE